MGTEAREGGGWRVWKWVEFSLCNLQSGSFLGDRRNTPAISPTKKVR